MEKLLRILVESLSADWETTESPLEKVIIVCESWRYLWKF